MTTHAVLIGVRAPQALRWSSAQSRFEPAAGALREGDIAFARLDGVANDLDAYARILENSEVDSGALQVERLDEPARTTLASVTTELSRHVDPRHPCTCSTLVIVMVGHGFRWMAYDDSEPDRMDELFALSDLPLIDDWWVPFWKGARTDMKAVVIVDSCHSDSIAYRAAPIEPVIHYDTTSAGPRRVLISAAMQEQQARERSFGNKVQGVLTRELLRSWDTPANRGSYSTWYDYASRFVNNPYQTAVMRVVDPLASMERELPFV
ncbi:caspase family protein [Microbacterium sp. LWH3-1.2]|uniref:caspase family protein n=1 Tax=Microbacterium sp. LWH3-1.2 TaxID=3135256 RepID=UPI0034166C16